MKIRNVLNTIILFIVLSLTVGFSAFVSEMSISNLVADVKLYEDVRVTGVRVVDSVNASANELDYDTDSIIGNINLNAFVSTLTLEVTITNFGNTPMGIYEITGLSDNLLKIVDGYTLKDKLCDTSGNCTLGSTTTFNVTIGYDTYDAVTKDHDIRLDFNFKEFYSVTYTDISNNNYPSYIMDGQTLSVNFGSNAPSKLDVYSNGALLDSSVYSYVNNTLIISEVTGDIEIRKASNACFVESGFGTEVGDVITCSTESFYVIDSNDDSIFMLAKYGLEVGMECYDDDDETGLLRYIENPSGIQNERTLNEEYGFAFFSQNNYWKSTNYQPAGDSIYPYVYGPESELYEYVENYSDYLRGEGVDVIQSQLISYEQAVKLGCKDNSCLEAPAWLYNMPYYFGSVGENDWLWSVLNNGYFKDFWCAACENKVRPVVEIPLNIITSKIKFNVDGITYTAVKGMTWADWVDSDYNVDNEFYYDEESGYILYYSQGLWVSSIDELIVENGVYYMDAVEETIPGI